MKVLETPFVRMEPGLVTKNVGCLTVACAIAHTLGWQSDGSHQIVYFLSHYRKTRNIMKTGVFSNFSFRKPASWIWSCPKRLWRIASHGWVQYWGFSQIEIWSLLVDRSYHRQQTIRKWYNRVTKQMLSAVIDILHVKSVKRVRGRGAASEGGWVAGCKVLRTPHPNFTPATYLRLSVWLVISVAKSTS